MFVSSVDQTPFTTSAANAYFTNITGDSFGRDRSFLATLRALLAPRMQEGESINLIFGSSNLTSNQVGSNSIRAIVASICGNYRLDTPGQIVVHSFNSDQASNMACFKVIESDFASIYEGYHRLDKVKVFYRKSFAVDCYINPDLKSVIVFVDRLDNKKMHHLQLALAAMFPWCFDPAESLSEDETALFYSLLEFNPDKYNECLAKMAEQYDCQLTSNHQKSKIKECINMTTEKMTVHKALCELKTMDARITRAIHGPTYVLANKHANAKVSGKSVSAYCEEVKSAYQSARDLIARRDAIKRAVTLSNATTKVIIGGSEFTVAEAIEMKNHGIPMRQKLLDKLANDNRIAQNQADANNGTCLETRADEYVKSLYGNADMKGVSDEIKKVRAEFITAQTMELVDPINVDAEMKRLEESINGFTVEIDSALSVSNALTEITVEY